MTDYLLDTNVLLPLVDPKSLQGKQAETALGSIWTREGETYITSQNLIEFWSVATRPIANNGLGWNKKRVQEEIDSLLYQFQLLEEQLTRMILSVSPL